MTLNGLPTVLRHETVWMDAHRYQDAERQYHEYCAQHLATVNASSVKSQNKAPQTNLEKGKPLSSLVSEIHNARENIKKILSGDMLANNSEILQRIQKLSDENKEMRKTMSEMATKIRHLEDILSDITISKSDKDLKQTAKFVDTGKQNGPTEKPEDDDDIDLFGSDEETEEEARIKEERLKAYENKKSKKPALIAKSSVVLDVKPWDDETDMNALENAVRAISSDGLKWGAGKLVPLAYGIKKLQIIAIVEDDKVSIDWLQEAIQENEDLVQSVDIAAFNKL